LTIPPKKVVNADPGDADHIGGNDWDDLADYMNNVDKTGPVKINTRQYFRSGKFEIRNPADTFSYVFVGGALTGSDKNITLPVLTSSDIPAFLGQVQTFTGAKTFNDQTLKMRNPADTFSYNVRTSAILADRDVTEPLLTANDTRVYQAHTQTLTNKTIDQISNTLKLQTKFKYIVFIDANDSNKVKCIDVESGGIVSNNTSAITTLQYAVDNAGGQPILIKRGLYTLSSELNCVDQDICLVGERSNAAENDTNDTVLKKSHSGNILSLDNTNGTGARQQLFNLTLDGNDKTGTGILANDIRFNMPFITNVYIVSCDIGIQLSRSWYSTFYNLQIDDCATYCLYMTNDGTGGTLTNGCNTLYFYGGRITNCDNINLYPEVVNDATFYSVILENDSSHAFTNAVSTTTRTSSLNLIGCSMESTGTGSQTIISELGENNHYIGLRFENGDANYTPINFGSTAKNCSLESCRIGTTATKTATITVNASAVNIRLMNNQKRIWITTTISLSDSSSTTTRLGNSFCNDRFPSGLEFGSGGLRILEIDANSLGVRDSGNTTYKNMFTNRVAAATLQTTGNVDNITLGATTTTHLLDTTITDAKNIILGSSTGTKIGTATTQKLAFFNATPIQQKGANADTSGATLGQLETEVNELKQLLRDYGLMA
jgi:hypothetical protein